MGFSPVQGSSRDARGGRRARSRRHRRRATGHRRGAQLVGVYWQQQNRSQRTACRFFRVKWIQEPTEGGLEAVEVENSLHSVVSMSRLCVKRLSPLRRTTRILSND